MSVDGVLENRESEVEPCETKDVQQPGECLEVGSSLTCRCRFSGAGRIF